MNEPKDPFEKLEDMLSRTRDHELDCDQFVELLAPYLDQGLDEHMRHLVQHHRDLCAECAEELKHLERALEARETEST
jgi:hypothetical protein